MQISPPSSQPRTQMMTPPLPKPAPPSFDSAPPSDPNRAAALHREDQETEGGGERKGHGGG